MFYLVPVGTLTDTAGSVIAVRPAPHISITPRGGDGVSLGAQLGVADRDCHDTGFTRLLCGTTNIGVGLCVDRGYPFKSSVNTGNNPTVIDWTDRNNVLMFWPFKANERAFHFDMEKNELEIINDNRDGVRALNSGRVCTYLRRGIENFHGAIKNTYKHLSGTLHHTYYDILGSHYINYYNNKYLPPVPLDLEWEESSAVVIDFIVVCGLHNRFHAKFHSSLPPDLEILCVDRIVFNLNTPNIVLDEQIKWNNNINIKAKVPLQRNIPGFVNFLIGDHSRIDTMDWPKLDEQSGYELYILGTGTYTNYRAMGTLTISREQELISQQADNQSLNQTNYNVLASSLPQCTKVHVAVQSNQPVGFNPLKYGGPWPEGSVDIIKLSFPSTMKTSTNRSNFHSVTLLLAHGTNLTNHLNLGPQLESLFGYHCDCESGMRTNASCCHVQAACIALFCPTMFRSAKKNVARLNDIRRPELRRPISSGPPANNRSRCLFISPNPIRRSRDSR